MARVDLVKVAKHYRDQVALWPTDLTVGDGEFLTLLGPSGCGKTTTLRIVAGFIEPSEGRVEIDGEDVTRLPPHKRQIGNVFQDYALFPHMTIAENIAFGLKERRWPRDEIRKRVSELLDLIKLPAVADRLPSQISGGQQQRVAFARAIAYQPRLLLMDEPLSALDLKLREAMQLELKRWQRQLGITTIFVTHDQTEAMTLSDRIAVMDQGRIAQIGSAREIYESPRTRFVAEFFGQINLAPTRATTAGDGFDVATIGDTHLKARPLGHAASGRIFVAVRPQHVAIAGTGAIPDGHNQVAAMVLSQTYNGNLSHIQVEALSEIWTVEARPNEYDVAPGSAVTLHWHPDHSLLLAD